MTWHSCDLRSPETAAPPVRWLILMCCLAMAACHPAEQDPRLSHGALAPALAPTLAQLPTARNVVLVLSDTHRYDHAAPLAEGWSQTPHVELLARQGIRFTDASTPIPISAPAYASLFTGLPPIEHGLLNNQQDLSADLPVLAEHLREQGYATAAVVGNPFCSAEHGFGRGFDHFWDAVEGHGKDGQRLTDEALRWLQERPTDRPFFLFVAYMDAHTPYVLPRSPPSLLLERDDLPWGTLVAEDAHRQHEIDIEVPPGGVQHWRLSHLDAHGRVSSTPQLGSPLYVVDLQVVGLEGEPSQLRLQSSGLRLTEENPRFRQMAQRVELEITNPTSETLRGSLRFRIYRRYEPAETPALYAAGVRHVDRQLGRLMANLDSSHLASDTAWVFVSDHGEMLGEHDAWGHVDQLWQESLQVPLIVKAPGLAAGSTFDGAFDLMDLHRLLRVLTGERGSELAATFPYVTGTAALDARVATTFPPEANPLQVAVRQGPLKLFLGMAGTPRLYDLAADPRETQDLFSRDGHTTAARQLLALARQQLSAAAEGERLDLEELSDEAIDRLRTLGYLD